MNFIKITKKVGSSFLKFVLMTALIHIVVLVFSTIKNGNIKFLNYFQILGLTEFWPKITDSWISDVISLIIMTMLIVGFLIPTLLKKTVKIKTNL